MTLDTVKVEITPADALQVLKQVDDRGESWQLVGGIAIGNKRVLTSWIEGDDGLLNITLNGDGTWSVKSHIILGEKS